MNKSHQQDFGAKASQSSGIFNDRNVSSVSTTLNTHKRNQFTCWKATGTKAFRKNLSGVKEYEATFTAHKLLCNLI